jgi:lipoprotein-releasing system permease protein
MPLFIARRYFLSKKKRNFINVISIISMLAVGFGAMALVVALSVFNGLEEMLKSLHAAFDPDLKIQLVKGKFFNDEEMMLDTLRSIEGVAVVSRILEDNAYVKYRDSRMFIRLKGVDDNYKSQGNLVDNIVEGSYNLNRQGIQYALIGRGVQYTLSLSMSNDFNTIQVYYPKKGVKNIVADAAQSTNQKSILPGGVFAIIKEYDEKYMIVPLDFARTLFEEAGKISALEIKVDEKSHIRNVKRRIKSIIGDDFFVLDKNEQHSSILRALKIEKLFVFLTFSFIISIAAFNIFFSLTMLGLEKRKDIAVLLTLGATDRLITRIFLLEGVIIAFSGGFIGLLLGFVIVWSQQQFGIISMGMSTSVIDAYPVKIVWMDFVLATLAIALITVLASYKPASLARKVNINTEL